MPKAYADGGKRAKAAPRWKRAVRARGFYYGGGYYSYRDRDVVSSWAWTRSLFISRSYFRTPLTGLQTPAGPFDSGFFFDSAEATLVEQRALSELRADHLHLGVVIRSAL